MDAFDFIKETTGGATVIETINGSTEEYFFGGNISPTFRKKSTSLVIEIGRYTFTVFLTATIRINTGTGLNTFSGTVAQLKTALIPVFPKAGSTALTTGVAVVLAATKAAANALPRVPGQLIRVAADESQTDSPKCVYLDLGTLPLEFQYFIQ